jgi:hypothetical protein
VSGVPQLAQNVRRTRAVEWNAEGCPWRKRKRVFGNVTHATTGAAATRRHVLQWQIMLFAGVPSTR